MFGVVISKVRDIIIRFPFVKLSQRTSGSGDNVVLKNIRSFTGGKVGGGQFGKLCRKSEIDY